MRGALTVGLTGMSILAHDPASAGFAPDAYMSAALSFAGIAGLAILTLWSERWVDRARPAAAATAFENRETFALSPTEAVAHSTAI